LPIYAYILINAEPGKDLAVAEAMSKIEGVKEIYPVIGPYNVAGTIEVSGGSLNFFLMKAKGIDGVKKILTLITRTSVVS